VYFEQNTDKLELKVDASLFGQDVNYLQQQSKPVMVFII